MSRIGNLPISIPAGVTITINGNDVTVKGSKGEMQHTVHPELKVSVENNEVIVARETDVKEIKAQHGLHRSLINNIIIGVSEGYRKEMELIGVGYRASNQGQLLELSLGYTHNIFLMLADEIKIETKMERNKSPLIIIESCDKALIGQVCAKIRSFRKPEPYKGKGIRFVGEQVRRKSGKAAGK